MWRSCVYWCGVALIAVAMVALPATSVVPMRLGGTAAGGYVKGGRYFVGSHGRYTEVSGLAWRLEWWVSRLLPWSILVPLHGGLFLIALSLPPGWRPAPAPPEEAIARASLAALPLVAVGAGLGWAAARAPWAALLGAWLGLYAGVWLTVQLAPRLARGGTAGDR